MEILLFLAHCTDLEVDKKYYQGVNECKQMLLQFPRNAEILLQLARFYHYLENWQNARKYYGLAIAADPFEDRAYSGLYRIRNNLPLVGEIIRFTSP
jgi:tetratricopeptide (TPR) repeat protein